VNPEPLPAEIGPIKVPRFFAPSKWVDLETCALAVWAGSVIAPVLPDTPDMMFGSLLHVVRRRYLSASASGHTPLGRVTALVEEEVSALEVRLKADGRETCVPLREAVGWRKWDDRIRRLKCWAEALDPAMLRATPLPHSPPTQRRGEPPEPKDWFSEGPEPWWQAVPLRLRGQPDDAHSASDGELWITDLKTGFVFTPDGDFRPEIVAQLELYALMAEYLARGKRVRLFVQHLRRDELRWDGEARAAIMGRLSALSARFLAEDIVDAPSVANPGPHCRNCGFRPACSAYLQRAPSWWPNEPANPRPLPYDVWGTVTRIEGGEYVRLELLDAAGRAVQVEGLRAAHGWDGVVLGSKVYLFNLEATEDAFRHGVRIHPRNFHEVAPGRAWSDALSVSAFS
jgi:hypothetical protein